MDLQASTAGGIIGLGDLATPVFSVALLVHAVRLVEPIGSRAVPRDSSLSPALEWDGQNGSRELGEWLLDAIGRASALKAPHEFAEPQEFRSSDGRVIATVRGLRDAVGQLKRLSKPFLNWAGKAERLSFDVPTLPLFVHERLSIKTIVDTLVGHRSDRQLDLYDMFGDPQHSITDQILCAYEYQDKWVNRMILGDSLVVMSSLLQYEVP